MATNREIIDVKVKGAKKAKKSLKGLGSSALKMGVAFFAAKGVIDGLKTIIDQGSKLKSVENAFKNMGNKVGFTDQALKKFQEATNGTVTKLELMTKANNAMALGIVESEDQFANLLDTAQRLGASLGQDTATALDSLVTGIGRQSKLMLDNLGIMIDTQGAYDKYAATLGRTAESLTEAERKQAFTNAAMEEAKRISAEMGDEQISVNDKLARLKTTFIDMAGTIGSSSEGLFSTFIEGAQDMADSLSDAIDFSATVDWSKSLSLDNFKTLMMNIIKNVFETFSILFNNLGFMWKSYWDNIGSWIWERLKELGKFLFEPLIINFKIIGQKLKLAWELIVISLKNGWIGFLNVFKDEYNRLAEAMPRLFGDERFDITPKIDKDLATSETQGVIDSLIEEMDNTALMQMFAPSEDQTVESWSELFGQIGDAWTDTADDIVLTNKVIDDSLDGTKKIIDSTGTTVTNVDKEVKKSSTEKNKTLMADMKELGEKHKAFKEAYKLTAISTTMMDAFASAQAQFLKYSKAFPAPFGEILGGIAAVTAIAAGVSRANKIKAAQYGADFVTSGPQMMMVGEGRGPERVQVTPLVDENINGPQGSSVVVNVSGNVMSDEFVEGQLIESIREGLRLGENMGIEGA